MRRFILCLRVITTAIGSVLLLQGCGSATIARDDNDDVIPVHRKNQTDMNDEVQKVSVILPIGQQYEQHNDECWSNIISVTD